MQYFGEFQTKYEEVFLTSSYMYFNREDEEITAKELKQKMKTHKDRKKNIIGTVFIYNPVVTPAGFDSNKFLLDQEFESFDELIEIKAESYITIFKQAMASSCEGKIVEIKNLFNLVEGHIDASSLLTKFNSDLEKYNSGQNTEFDRDIMYFDAANLIPYGKFIYFAWGEKISPKEFPFIKGYASTIYERCKDMGKNVVYVYKKEKSKQGAEDFMQFAHPTENYKYRASIANAFKASFDSFPPQITPYS